MENRIKITSSCRDCDTLRKHKKAGMIETDADGDKIQYMFNGVKILWDTYHSPWMNTIIENLKGHHEPQEELCFYYVLETLGENANMIELGSNWSYYSIWFNKFINNPTNICIEPVIEHMLNGQKNSKKNNCSNISFINGCVGRDYAENIKFHNWDSRILNIDRYSIEKIITGTDLFFDIIHSDIQGAELDMLKGSINVLDRIGYFIISTHGDLVHNECLNFLKSNGFKILVEHNGKESYSVDGLILAINKSNVDKYEHNIGGNIFDFFTTNCIISKKN